MTERIEHTSEKASLLGHKPRQLIGIFGGTFDPVHSGHQQSLNLLCNEIAFDRIYWVLSARPPHKQKTISSTKHRFAMLKLALAGHPVYIADDTEIRRKTSSYTVDTLAEFKSCYPSAKLLVIIGADSLLSLPSWHRYEELVEQASWVVLHRPGYPAEPPQELQDRLVDFSQIQNIQNGQICMFEDSNIDISSTEIRTELEKPNGLTSALIKQNLSSDVIRYIRDQQLYKIDIMNSEQLKDQVIEALENIKGQDIKVIDIADISDFADYMVVASGTSDTHVKALAREASDHLRRQGQIPLNEDGADVGEWVLVDFGDVVLHVMRPEVREYYDLEKLWDTEVRNLVKKHRELSQD
ncbi:MAG: nicotinate-nucleotide adenylyltransferase [Cryomorphaceae bacterium]|jgi:nicotinate-nucleotide adenylyltransferase